MSELKYFTFFSLFWCFVLVIFNFIIDPLQYYSKSDNPIFIYNERYQNAGLIRNYYFDMAYLGTSHSENFKPEIFDSTHQTTGLNLAVSGSSSDEQYQVGKLILSKGYIKKIIWEMNYKSFSGINSNLKTKGNFPYYLYNESFKTPFLYLFSIDTLWLSFKNIMGLGSTRLSGLNSWREKEKNKFDGENVIKHYCQAIKNRSRNNKKFDYRLSIETNFISLVSNNPKTKFLVFIPPLSIYNFALPNQAESLVDFRKFIYEYKEKFSNIIIYDFMLDYDLLSHPLNYKDIEHFSPEISDMILEKISLNTHGIFSKNITIENLKFTNYVNEWLSKNENCT